MVTELSTTDYDTKIVKGKGIAIVDIWAPWCGPCKAMAPVFEDLSHHYDDILFAKLDADKNGELAAKLGVRGIPTLILFKDGKEVGRVVGAVPKETIIDEIEKVL